MSKLFYSLIFSLNIYILKKKFFIICRENLKKKTLQKSLLGQMKHDIMMR